MAIRDPFNPFNNGANMVDTFIGDSYRTVQFVAYNMPTIEKVAAVIVNDATTSVELRINEAGKEYSASLNGILPVEVSKLDIIFLGSDGVVRLCDHDKVNVTLDSYGVHVRTYGDTNSPYLKSTAKVVVTHKAKSRGEC